MIFAATDTPANELGKYGESVHSPIPHVFYATKETGRISHRLDLSYLPLDANGLVLRLRESPRLVAEPYNRRFNVEIWNVTCGLTEIPELPFLMARRFIELNSKAERGILNDQEEIQWLSILDVVDYQQFSIERAFPHYSEGQITRKSPQSLTVEWEDGTREVLRGRSAGPFTLFREGEFFSAYVKLGRDNATVSVEQISLLDGNRTAS